MDQVADFRFVPGEPTPVRRHGTGSGYSPTLSERIFAGGSGAHNTSGRLSRGGEQRIAAMGYGGTVRCQTIKPEKHRMQDGSLIRSDGEMPKFSSPIVVVHYPIWLSLLLRLALGCLVVSTILVGINFVAASLMIDLLILVGFLVGLGGVALAGFQAQRYQK